MAGAPLGNNNAGKNKAWDAALRRAIAQDNADRLRRAAEQLLTLASEGEQWAIKEIADRLDGKAHQSIDAVVDASITIEVVKFAD